MKRAFVPDTFAIGLVAGGVLMFLADRGFRMAGLIALNDRLCRWPMGHPGEPDFHFCGQAANPGYPYCVQHCGVAYQAQLPRRDRRPPPPLPFGGPRVR